MNEIRFEWNEDKAKRNLKKHEGVSFEEASSVFDDEKAILFDDPDHSEYEDRFLLLGMSLKTRLLIVCHCYREGDNVIRIISARKATNSEAKQYTEINNKW